MNKNGQPYGFVEQLAVGKAGERELDELFSRWYRIIPALEHQERRGIDRIFKRYGPSGPLTYGVEYKTDHTAGTTGNAFIETASNVERGVLGWARTSEATHLAYFVPPLRKVYLLFMPAVQAALGDWVNRFETRWIPNKGYHSMGVLVPLAELEALAIKVYTMLEESCKDRTDPETTAGVNPGQSTSPGLRALKNQTRKHP